MVVVLPYVVFHSALVACYVLTTSIWKSDLQQFHSNCSLNVGFFRYLYPFYSNKKHRDFWLISKESLSFTRYHDHFDSHCTLFTLSNWQKHENQWNTWAFISRDYPYISWSHTWKNCSVDRGSERNLWKQRRTRLNFTTSGPAEEYWPKE